MKFMLKQEMLLMVRALYFCMEDTWDKIGKKYNISPAQQHILFLLSTNGNELTPTKIGELGCWHPSTVSRLLNRLQMSGYIEMKAGKRSKFKMVSMTEEGKQLLAQLLDTAKSMEQFPFDMQHISENEILSFLECGQRILDVHKGKDFRKNVISKQVDNFDYAWVLAVLIFIRRIAVMSRDKGILISIWFITAMLVLKFVKKNEIKHGILAFQFKQMITWLVGLLVVEKGLIRYPVREFKKANKTSFTFEYFIYPAFCAIFNVRYPENKGKGIKILYYILHAGIITIMEVIIEKYTDLVTYIKWRWYWTFITIGLTYYISRLFYRWFFKDEFNSFI